MILKCMIRHFRTDHRWKNVRCVWSGQDNDRSKKAASLSWSNLITDEEGDKLKPKPQQLKAENEVTFVPFNDFVNERRESAKRSIMVQVKSKDSANDLIRYCQRNFGHLASLQFFHNPNNTAFDSFFIAEFDEKDVVSEILCNHARHRWDTKDNFPVFSPFLWLSNVENGEPQSPPNSKTFEMGNVPVHLPADDVHAMSDEEGLKSILSIEDRIEDQMNALFHAFKLSTLCEKIRFLACEQLESSIRGLFPTTAILPFGSSVNSFGNRNCDLDMVVSHRNQNEIRSSRLVFHTKGAGGAYARRSKDNTTLMSYMSYAIQNFLPGCQSVQNVFNARVPIVKFKQDFMDLDCDLSSASSGYHMSGLLYLWGTMDPRVRPLVFTVRKWAMEHNIVGSVRPTSLFTNFPLTLMVIFFLQCKHQILPPFATLQSMARPEDKLVAEDGLDCTFLGDITGVQYALNSSILDKTKAELSLSELLYDFFEFYALFNYNEHAICVVSGEIQQKKRPKELEITNPLDPRLNVAANVKLESVFKLRKCCLEACHKFDVLSKIQEASQPSLDPDIGGKLLYIVKPYPLPGGVTQSLRTLKKGTRQLAPIKKPRMPSSAELFDIT